ncbi:hypothetical protein Pcinc_023184 [Petrolisthes cinctipes]|uniref:Uncharacterized protein n=1 Tax=Petrolisthes cinctipes TaxID=88211 RepID=A0AAE1FES8_PETCI|nr:hypothetical protein Pcinc_023184 [Petrolisthes cinctipes]
MDFSQVSIIQVLTVPPLNSAAVAPVKVRGYLRDPTLGTVHYGTKTAAHFRAGVRTQDNLQQDRRCYEPKQPLRRHLHPRTRSICLLNHMIYGIPGRFIHFISL